MSLKRVSVNGSRFYQIEDGLKLPSVTTVLDKTVDKSYLFEWRKRVGEEEANRISRESAGRGDVMHNLLENYTPVKNHVKIVDYISDFKSTHDMSLRKNLVGLNLFIKIYNAGYFSKVKEVFINEVYMYYIFKRIEKLPSLVGYAGTCDFGYTDVDGKNVIADFKSSRTRKDARYIENYFMQVSGYAIAYWQRTGTIPDKAEIWISNEQDNEPQLFVLTQDHIKKYFNKLKSHVYKFYFDHVWECPPDAFDK